MTTPFVRPADEGDLEPLLALEALFPDADQLSRASWRHLLRSANCVVVLDTGTTLVGNAVVLYRRNSPLARLYSLIIDPERRGQGLASHLLKAVEADARYRKRSVLSLEVRASNQAAIALYTREGFTPFRTQAGYYSDGEDALVMRKSLIPPDTKAHP